MLKTRQWLPPGEMRHPPHHGADLVLAAATGQHELGGLQHLKIIVSQVCGSDVRHGSHWAKISNIPRLHGIRTQLSLDAGLFCLQSHMGQALPPTPDPGSSAFLCALSFSFGPCFSTHLSKLIPPSGPLHWLFPRKSTPGPRKTGSHHSTSSRSPVLRVLTCLSSTQ